jgi:hypothetical protein
MFGFFKNSINSLEFNSIYTSCFVWLAAGANAFPTSQKLKERMDGVMKERGYKLNSEQENSIRIIDALMPSQKETLLKMAHVAYGNILKGDPSSLNELSNKFKQFFVLSH